MQNHKQGSRSTAPPTGLPHAIPGLAGSRPRGAAQTGPHAALFPALTPAAWLASAPPLMEQESPRFVADSSRDAAAGPCAGSAVRHPLLRRCSWTTVRCGSAPAAPRRWTTAPTRRCSRSPEHPRPRPRRSPRCRALAARQRKEVGCGGFLRVAG